MKRFIILTVLTVFSSLFHYSYAQSKQLSVSSLKSENIYGKHAHMYEASFKKPIRISHTKVTKYNDWLTERSVVYIDTLLSEGIIMSTTSAPISSEWTWSPWCLIVMGCALILLRKVLNFDFYEENDKFLPLNIIIVSFMTLTGWCLADFVMGKDFLAFSIGGFLFGLLIVAGAWLIVLGSWLDINAYPLGLLILTCVVNACFLVSLIIFFAKNIISLWSLVGVIILLCVFTLISHFLGKKLEVKVVD